MRVDDVVDNVCQALQHYPQPPLPPALLPTSPQAPEWDHRGSRGGLDEGLMGVRGGPERGQMGVKWG